MQKWEKPLSLHYKQICNCYNFIMFTKSIAQYLIEHGIKPSLQRMAVMEYLLTHKTHPTADEIYNALYPSIPTLSKTTVYNTLKLFVEHNAILSLDINERNMHFDGDVSPHSHFRCRVCGTIFDVAIPRSAIAQILEVDEVEIDEVQIYYKGICKHCKPKTD